MASPRNTNNSDKIDPLSVPPIINALVQARMSSTRFPGKVLMPFRGRPVIEHILETLRSISEINDIILVTSTEESDDPLAAYASHAGYKVFRGPLQDVFRRFQLCAVAHPCDWLLRICADSPLLSPLVVREVIRCAIVENCDVVTTRFAPAFPKGQNAEMIRASALLEIDHDALNDYQREHVTPWFYEHAHNYRISNAQPVDIGLPGNAFTVDTPADLRRLESLVSA